MTRYLLDANLILRFLRDDHAELSPKARALFAQAASGDCVLLIPGVVLAECVLVLRSYYKADRELVALTLTKLISKPGVEADEPALAVEALSRMATTNADYADCYLAARSAAHDHPVASFDKDFRKFKDVRRWEG